MKMSIESAAARVRGLDLTWADARQRYQDVCALAEQAAQCGFGDEAKDFRKAIDQANARTKTHVARVTREVACSALGAESTPLPVDFFEAEVTASLTEATFLPSTLWQRMRERVGVSGESLAFAALAKRFQRAFPRVQGNGPEAGPRGSLMFPVWANVDTGFRTPTYSYHSYDAIRDAYRALTDLLTEVGITVESQAFEEWSRCGLHSYRYEPRLVIPLGADLQLRLHKNCVKFVVSQKAAGKLNLFLSLWSEAQQVAA
jgi:hypothetical protein